ncbi:MAG: aminotransferase class V-fold PLP-dependent enzyme, partial [Thermomicrobiales bacterium]
PGARRFEYGGRTFSYDTAMAAGVEYVDALGVETVREHQRELLEYAHQGLNRIAGAHVRSPKPPFETTGILTISLDNLGGTEASAALRERWKIITRPALRASSVRVSLAPYTTLEDVDVLLGAFDTLSKE